MKITFSAITLEPEVVETSGWLQNVPYRMALLQATLSFDVRRHVFTSRDIKKMKKSQFLKIVKVNGQT